MAQDRPGETPWDQPDLRPQASSGAGDGAARPAEANEGLTGLESVSESMAALETSLPTVPGQTQEPDSVVSWHPAASARQSQPMERKPGQAAGGQDPDEPWIREQPGADSMAARPAPLTGSVAAAENPPEEKPGENTEKQENEKQKPPASSPAAVKTGNFSLPKITNEPATDPAGRHSTRQEPAGLMAGKKSGLTGLENIAPAKMPEQESATQTENQSIRKKEIKTDSRIFSETDAVEWEDYPQKIHAPTQHRVSRKLETPARLETGQDLRESLPGPTPSRSLDQVLESVQAWASGQEALVQESVPAKAARPHLGQKTTERQTEKRPESVQDGIRDFTLSIGSIHLTVEEPRPAQGLPALPAPARPAAPTADASFLRWERHYLNS